MPCLNIVPIYSLLYALILVNSVKRLKMYFNLTDDPSEERDSLAVLTMKKKTVGFSHFIKHQERKREYNTELCQPQKWFC